MKIPLLGQDEGELVRFAQSLDQPAYRGRQLFEWLYKKKASTFEEMTNLSADLRSMLSEKAAVHNMTVVKRQESVDGTKKFLFELPDGLRVESVLIRSERKQKEEDGQAPSVRTTLCVSTQVGCPLDCTFCATASMGFLRNLRAGEIVGQVLSVAAATGVDISNIVFMGMGEPLMNYDEVMKSAGILIDGAGFAPRRITVSTAGWVDRIRQMADEERKIKLAVSLHSAIEATRRKLMPVTKRHSVREISDAIEYYVRRSGRDVMLEQTFFAGVNDTDEEVSALIRFSRRASCRVNVIPFHSIGNTGPTGFSATLRPSPLVETIVRRMREAKVPVFVRKSSGVDIDAACGQLAVRSPAPDETVVPA
ncbi:MAG: 23S rRNA (adenine(2503)-C(2))-methyltransferase RlmN [Ignavibacteria bacterium]|nr:23S rRNA (adenine(2503)-C(2))-methyltransferase RlmN [Ignavibacteria bacterium]